MKVSHMLLIVGLVTGLLAMTACEVRTPSIEKIRDSRLFDPRVKETPRQKTMRQCRLEAERYRIDCQFCHTTNKAEDIQSPNKLELTKSGERARIMRSSPTFGLNQDCSMCHHSKFQLNRNAQKQFGPGGARQTEGQKVLQPNL